MRLWLNSLLLACIAAGVAVIYTDAQKPSADVQTNTGIPLRVNMIDEEKLKSDLADGPQEDFLQTQGAVDSSCFVYSRLSCRIYIEPSVLIVIVVLRVNVS